MGARWVIAPQGLIEPVPAPEIFVYGIGAIEVMPRGNLRVILFQEQLPIEGGPVQRIVVAKLVGPMSNVPIVIGQLAQCLVDPDEPTKPRLVR